MPSNQQETGIISGINVTPLVDVMLVLLVIFIVTAKIIVTPAAALDLPKAAKTETCVVFSVIVPEQGPVTVNGQSVPDDSGLADQARSAVDDAAPTCRCRRASTHRRRGVRASSLRSRRVVLRRVRRLASSGGALAHRLGRLVGGARSRRARARSRGDHRAAATTAGAATTRGPGASRRCAGAQANLHPEDCYVCARPDGPGGCSSSGRGAAGLDRFERRGRKGRHLRRWCLHLIGDLHPRCRGPGDRGGRGRPGQSPAERLAGRVGMVLRMAARGRGGRDPPGDGRAAGSRTQQRHGGRGEDRLRSRLRLRSGCAGLRAPNPLLSGPRRGRRGDGRLVAAHSREACDEMAGARVVARRRRHQLPPRADDRAGLRQGRRQPIPVGKRPRYAIDAKTFKVISHFNVGGRPRSTSLPVGRFASRVSPDDKKVYVSTGRAGKPIIVLDAATGASLDTPRVVEPEIVPIRRH